jgi:hypothetical protein
LYHGYYTETLRAVFVKPGQLRIDIIETFADADKLVRRNLDNVVNIDEVALKRLGKKRNENLLAKFAELRGVHIAPVCALEASFSMLGNIARRDCAALRSRREVRNRPPRYFRAYQR